MKSQTPSNSQLTPLKANQNHTKTPSKSHKWGKPPRAAQAQTLEIEMGEQNADLFYQHCKLWGVCFFGLFVI